MSEKPGKMPVAVIGTWPFSDVGVDGCVSLLQAGKSAVNAVCTGVQLVELDETVPSVGYGGLPNASGVLQLDAAIMDGRSGKAGSVTCLEGYKAAAPIAFAVMQRSKHTMLAGPGASTFAASCGFQPHAAPGDMLPANVRARYEEYKQSSKKQISTVTNPSQTSTPPQMQHTDTVGMICLDADGTLAAACATSGTEFKEPGRVGDSPLIGCGLYLDQTVGAAVASGDGDSMIKHCLSFLVVEFMRGGDDPKRACERALERVARDDPTCQAAICAMDTKGATGAACTHVGFTVCQAVGETVPVAEADPACNKSAPVHGNGYRLFKTHADALSTNQWKHTCK